MMLGNRRTAEAFHSEPFSLGNQNSRQRRKVKGPSIEMRACLSFQAPSLKEVPARLLSQKKLPFHASARAGLYASKKFLVRTQVELCSFLRTVLQNVILKKPVNLASLTSEDFFLNLMDWPQLPQFVFTRHCCTPHSLPFPVLLWRFAQIARS